MAESKVKIRIGSEADLGAFGKLKNALSSMGSKMKSWAKGIGSNLMNVKAGFDMLKGAVQGLGGLLKKALDAETMTMQFKTLLGSMEEAQQHMAMLQKMGDTPPFSLEEFAAVSRTMLNFSDGALGMQNSLELVGDAAAATGKPLEQVGEAVAKAYAMIRDGQPVSKVANNLRNLGLISPQTAADLKELQDAGASNVEIWNKLEDALKKYEGAMAETEQTGNGMIGAIQSNWDDVMREFGKTVMTVGQSYLSDLLDWLKKLREDGSVQVFAEKFTSYMSDVVDALKTVGGWIGKTIGWLKESFTEVFSVVGDVGAAMANGAGFKDAVDFASGQSIARDREKELDKAHEAEVRANARKKAEEEKAREEQKKAEEKARREKILAETEAEKAAAEQRMEEFEAFQSEYAAMEKQFAEEAQAKIDADAKAEEAQAKKRAQAIKDKAAKEKKAAEEAHNLKMQNLDAEIKKTEEFQKLYDQAMQKGMDADRQRGAGWGGGGYQYTVDANGNPNNVADAQRAERFAEAGTEQKNKAAHREAADERRHQRILNDWAKGRKLSSSDERFLESRERMFKRRAADKKIEELQQQKDQAVLDLKNIVQRIETNMDTQLKAMGVK